MAMELRKMKDQEHEKGSDPLVSDHSLKQRLQTPPSVSSNQPSAQLPSTSPEDQNEQELKMEGEEQKESNRLNEETVLSSSSAPVTDLQKKLRRAERFGMSVQLSEKEKRSSRAERFGTRSVSHGSEEMKKSEGEKRKARTERFGLSANSMADEEAKKKARLARFAAVAKLDTEEEDKRKTRAVRFSQTSKSGPSQVNGEAEAGMVTSAVPR